MLPVDSNVVKHGELSNDGSRIHLYFDKNSSVWMAYGASAYSLRLYVKRMGYDCLWGFSDTLQMPCTLVNDDTVKCIVKELGVEQRNGNAYICLVANATFVTNTASVNMLIFSQLSINSIARKHRAYGLQCALKLIEESHIVLEI